MRRHDYINIPIHGTSTRGDYVLENKFHRRISSVFLTKPICTQCTSHAIRFQVKLLIVQRQRVYLFNSHVSVSFYSLIHNIYCYPDIYLLMGTISGLCMTTSVAPFTKGHSLSFIYFILSYTLCDQRRI